MACMYIICVYVYVMCVRTCICMLCVYIYVPYMWYIWLTLSLADIQFGEQDNIDLDWFSYIIISVGVH